MDQLIVAKFGGTSMADATAMLRSAKISRDHKAKIVVVSATSGTTNQLLELATKAEKGSWEDCEIIIKSIETKHRSIASELELAPDQVKVVEQILTEMSTLARGINLLKECSLRAKDQMQSIGERLSSVLFTTAVRRVFESTDQVSWLDVRSIMITDSQFGKAVPNIVKIANKCKKLLPNLRSEEKIYITQGFIGKDENGITTTLGRGGSDYSATLIGEGIGADLVQIWTDVAGIATTDPRICPKAQPIDVISFKEAAELAVFGAKVLHPTTLSPALRANIAVFVGSSYESEAKGTWIKKSSDSTPLVRAMAIKRDQALLTITTPKMMNAYGFLSNIFNVFAGHKVSVDAITTSEISVSMTVDAATAHHRELLHDLKRLGEVTLEEKQALVSLIGNNINHTPGLGSNIFKALGDINVRMICQGASKHNFCFLVGDSDGTEAVKRLHAAFIESAL
tara:strand:- start:9815 stop:11176 length:1362 start_codon:yes stop_codon:yes gene_type:complete